MLAFLIATTIGAMAPQGAPTLAVVVTRRTSVTPTLALGLANRVSSTLAAAGFTVPASPMQVLAAIASAQGPDPSTCAGRRPCAAQLGSLAHVDAVVTVEAGTVEGVFAFHLEAIASSDGQLLAKRDFVQPKRGPKNTVERETKVFADQFRDAWSKVPSTEAPPPLPPPPPPPPEAEAPPVSGPASPNGAGSDVPRQDTAPSAPPTSVAVSGRVEPPPSKSAAPYVTGGLCVVALAATGTFTGIGMVQRNQLNSGLTMTSGGAAASPLTYRQAQSIAARSNTSFTIATIAGGTALAFAAITGVLAAKLWGGSP
jgi:hypothetical protein